MDIVKTVIDLVKPVALYRFAASVAFVLFILGARSGDTSHAFSEVTSFLGWDSSQYTTGYHDWLVDPGRRRRCC